MRKEPLKEIRRCLRILRALEKEIVKQRRLLTRKASVGYGGNSWLDEAGRFSDRALYHGDAGCAGAATEPSGVTGSDRGSPGGDHLVEGT